MGKFNFSENSWEEYLYWQVSDKKVLKRIKMLLKDISRNGAKEGLGKPELLKANLSGLYSSRIDEKNRLVYFVSDNGDIEIIQCKRHYNDK